MFQLSLNRLKIEAMPAPTDDEEVFIGRDCFPSVAPEVPDVDLRMILLKKGDRPDQEGRMFLFRIPRNRLRPQ